MASTTEPFVQCKQLESTVNNTVPTRCEDFWFHDGSVVLHVENTQFRVHQSLLSMHSKVFRDMFAVPQPVGQQLEEYMEGSPIVRLLDIAADWAYLLSGLYDGSKNSLKETTMSFPAVAAFLRLGNKYEIPQFRTEALRRLTKIFPSEQPDWDLTQEVIWDEISFDDGIEIDVFNLARETGILCLIPAAFLSIVQENPNALKIIIEGAERSDGSITSLSLEDQRICILAVETLQTRQKALLLKWVESTCGSSDPVKCASHRAQIFYQLFCVDSIIQMLDDWYGEDEGCQFWIDDSKSVHQSGRLDIWNELPSMLGLPDWDELRKT